MVQEASAKMCMFVLGLKGRQHATHQFRLKHIMHLFLSGILTIVNAKKKYYFSVLRKYILQSNHTNSKQR